MLSSIVLLFQGITNPCQRDEILVQICNQMYKNPDKEAMSRCCRLLLQAVGVFSPTEAVLPMLIRCFLCLHTAPCCSYIRNVFFSFANQQKPLLQTQLLNTLARRMNMFENQVSPLRRMWEKAKSLENNVKILVTRGNRT